MPSTASIALDLLARGQRYRYGPHPQNRADLHVPRDGEHPFPVVVLIHGGYWRATYGKVVMKPLAADLVRRGFATWNVEYRRLGRRQGGGYPMTFDDVANAIDRLAELDDQRLDLADATLIGHSAGGHLALWAASRGEPRVEPARVIAQAPITNLARAGASGHELMGGTPDQVPDRYSKTNPVQLLPLGIPAVVVHGPGDMTIPVERSREYVAAARAAGDQIELIEPQLGGHRSHIDPRSAAWRAATGWLATMRGARVPSARPTSPPAAR